MLLPRLCTKKDLHRRRWGRAVDQSQSESGGADFLLKKKHCMHCKLFVKHCCGYFCCSAEEYARYIKGEAVLPHN
ncbi:hypothetical protein EJ110_NYTH40859 [Nymphaea thermarum]|nr:hypothetical protein EJ110_NYTH40859 [Nymphaea thermarum]